MDKIWVIKEPNNIEKILNRLGSVERNRYYDLISNFETCKDPSKLGKLEIIKGNRLFVARLNKSYRVVYFIHRRDRAIIILAVGDHKEVGLKE